MESPRRFPGAGPRTHVIAWLALLAVALLLFAQSYTRWGDLIIDLGRDLSLPGEILKGRVLYRDLIYNYGPVAPYLLAGAVALLGDHLWVFAGAGILSGAAVAAGLYALGWLLGGLGVAIAGALLFIVLNFFANTTWGCNFVLPYSHAAVMATGFAVWSVVFLFRYLYQGRRRRDGMCAVVLLFLAVFTKQEVGLAVVAVHGAAWWAHRIPGKVVLRVLLTGLGFFLLLVALFAARSPGEHALFRENLSRFEGNSVTDAFFLGVAGLDDWRENLGVEIAAFAGPALVLLAVNLLAVAGGRFRTGRPFWLPALLGSALLAPLLLSATLRRSFGDVRAIGVVLWIALFLVLFQAVRRPRDPLLLLGVFVIFSAPRIPLAYHPLWYGFYLCVPAYPFLTELLGFRLPRLLPAPRFTQAVAALLGLIVLARFEGDTLKSHRAMSGELVTAKGTLRDYPVGRTEAVGQFLAHLAGKGGTADAGMVVFPEGVSLNYFAGISNPTAYYSFIPPELASPPEAEERMLRELRKARPDYVVFVSRDLGEFGVREFGIDYARRIGAWVQGNYRVERIFSGRGHGSFQVVLMTRAEGNRGVNPGRP